MTLYAPHLRAPQAHGTERQRAASAGGSGPEAAPRPCHDARALTGPTGEALIALDGKTYHLRITRHGKLILTK
jgi:hemin uptake protein HemP